MFVVSIVKVLVSSRLDLAICTSLCWRSQGFLLSSSLDLQQNLSLSQNASYDVGEGDDDLGNLTSMSGFVVKCEHTKVYYYMLSDKTEIPYVILVPSKWVHCC